MKPSKIEIMPFGFSISFKLKVKDYNRKIIQGNKFEIKKIIVALSGPLTNLLIILGMLLTKVEFIPANTVIYANIIILLFNLIPIYPLDGGRILKSIVHIFFGGKNAKIVTNKVANISIILLTFISSIGIFYFENIAIFLVIMFLWWLVIYENKKYKIIMNAYTLN